MKELELKITGMTCHHCVIAVRKHLSHIGGVDVHDVGIGSARLTYDESKVSLEMLERAVEEAGYSVV